MQIRSRIKDIPLRVIARPKAADAAAVGGSRVASSLPELSFSSPRHAALMAGALRALVRPSREEFLKINIRV